MGYPYGVRVVRYQNGMGWDGISVMCYELKVWRYHLHCSRYRIALIKVQYSHSCPEQGWHNTSRVLKRRPRSSRITN
jgi:hypothetical protein